MRKIVMIFLIAGVYHATAQTRQVAVGTVLPTQQVSVHDPVMIRQGNTFYVFSTGTGINISTSTDLENWKKEKPVFDAPPKWAMEAVPGFKGHIWAPDVIYRNGKYFLYYSVSTFGKNNSCIGLAINRTLDSQSPDYFWEDQGKIIQSVPGRDQWNAIDPNVIVDESNTAWLSFGSFWSGIKLVKLSTDMRSLHQPEEWHSIASRQAKTPNPSPGNSAIEAPFIFRKNNYYYLFVSWDYCCRGEKSDYKVVVGRSEKITGPYLDKQGTAMKDNGGSIVVEGDNKTWFGVGHNAVYNHNNKDYVIYHGYDAADKGKPKLIIRTLSWDKDGWPEIKNKSL